MGMDARPTNLRCSALVLREDTMLLCQRVADWVLPGGTPRDGETVAACVRREAREETGLAVTPESVAFVLDATNSEFDQHLVEIVFLCAEDADTYLPPQCTEAGLVPAFVPLDHLPRMTVQPPIGGHIRAFHHAGNGRTAAYLGNVWRPGTGTALRSS